MQIQHCLAFSAFQNSPEVDDEGYSIRPDDDSEGDILTKLTNPSHSKLDLLTCQGKQKDESSVHQQDRNRQRSPPVGIIVLFPRGHFSQVMMCFILFQYFLYF